MKIINFFREAGFLVATTIGAGIFALPYIFNQTGWVVSVGYLITIAAVIILAHSWYLKTLQKTGERDRLLGLANRYYGKKGRYFSFLIILAGLFLTLTAFLILGGDFLEMVFPGLSGPVAIFIFWILGSFPFLLKSGRVLNLEFFGGVAMLVIILAIFLTALPFKNLVLGAAITGREVFLPFGAFLFSLAGWTAVEPIFDFQKRRGEKSSLGSVIFWGTAIPVVFYFLFAIAILTLTTGGTVTTDSFSGLANWPAWKLELLGIFGLFAIWTSYVPIGLELRNAFIYDLKWPRFSAIGLLLALPIILLLAGFTNFLETIGVAGGIFVALQYVIIILVAVKALAFRGWKRILAGLLVMIFLAAVVYEIYYFVIR